jgi:hypothetical protein
VVGDGSLVGSALGAAVVGAAVVGEGDGAAVVGSPATVGDEVAGTWLSGAGPA